eukprot:1748696-Pyramimonas_sp.AAC.1
MGIMFAAAPASRTPSKFHWPVSWPPHRLRKPLRNIGQTPSGQTGTYFIHAHSIPFFASALGFISMFSSSGR